MTAPHDDYAARQAQMDREYIEAGGDAPNHQRQFPQVFRGAPVDDVVQPIYPDDTPELEPIAPLELNQAGLVKRFIAFLEATKEEKFKLRRLAFLLLIGRVEMSFEELGKATGVSTSTARREFFRVDEFFRGR